MTADKESGTARTNVRQTQNDPHLCAGHRASRELDQGRHYLSDPSRIEFLNDIFTRPGLNHSRWPGSSVVHVDPAHSGRFKSLDVVMPGRMAPQPVIHHRQRHYWDALSEGLVQGAVGQGVRDPVRHLADRIERDRSDDDDGRPFPVLRSCGIALTAAARQDGRR